MTVLANVFGIAAVIVFVLSYQFKAKSSIIICNALSRVLYVTQYFLLGAFEGAWLDITAFVVSLLCLAQAKSKSQKSLPILIVSSNLLVVGVGMLSYKNLFSLLPILGVIFETQALYLKSVKTVLWMSLLGAPFWLVYNFLNDAYGSLIGNVITIISITIALIRQYRKKKASILCETEDMV